MEFVELKKLANIKNIPSEIEKMLEQYFFDSFEFEIENTSERELIFVVAGDDIKIDFGDGTITKYNNKVNFINYKHTKCGNYVIKIISKKIKLFRILCSLKSKMVKIHKFPEILDNLYVNVENYKLFMVENLNVKSIIFDIFESNNKKLDYFIDFHNKFNKDIAITKN